MMDGWVPSVRGPGIMNPNVEIYRSGPESPREFVNLRILHNRKLDTYMLFSVGPIFGNGGSAIGVYGTTGKAECAAKLTALLLGVPLELENRGRS